MLSSIGARYSVRSYFWDFRVNGARFGNKKSLLFLVASLACVTKSTQSHICFDRSLLPNGAGKHSRAVITLRSACRVVAPPPDAVMLTCWFLVLRCAGRS